MTIVTNLTEVSFSFSTSGLYQALISPSEADTIIVPILQMKTLKDILTWPRSQSY